VSQIGIFEGRGDVGTVVHPGSAEYAAAKGSYTMAASGETCGLAKDAFQFTWRKCLWRRHSYGGHFLIGTSAQEHRQGDADGSAKPGCGSRMLTLTLHETG